MLKKTNLSKELKLALELKIKEIKQAKSPEIIGPEELVLIACQELVLYDRDKFNPFNPGDQFILAIFD